MKISKNCVECGAEVYSRVGRGLCRKCWDDPLVRAKHPPLAPFGGREACKFWLKRKLIAGMEASKP